MRKLELRVVEGATGRPPLEYKQLLRGLIEAPAGGSEGMRIAEMRNAVRVLDKIDRAGADVVLEEDEWRFVKDRVERANYTVADQRVIDFCDHVINAAEMPKAADAEA